MSTPTQEPAATRGEAAPRARRRIDLDPLLEAAFASLLRRKRRYPPLFIVGAPRSGTTLCYQLLVNRFRFAYLPNVSNRHLGAPTLAAWRHRLTEGVPVTWESAYGVVEGSMAPADGRPVLRPWLPQFDEEPPGIPRVEELEALVARLEWIFGGPFANKSNPLSMFVGLLARTFPDALFVHVRRDFVDATASLMEARRKHAVPTGEWWGATPPQYRHLRCGSELEQSLRTLFGAERWIAARLAELPERRRMDVEYSELCSDPSRVARSAQDLYRAAGVELEERSSEVPASFAPRTKLGDARTRAAFAREVAGWLEKLEAEASRPAASGGARG